MSSVLRKLRPFAFVLAVVCLSSCNLNKVSISIADNWKYKNGDNESWKETDFDDSEWQDISKLSIVTLKTSNYAWLRKTVEIPSSLRGQEVYFGFLKSNCAAEIYAGGQYIGTRGKMPPSPNIRSEKTEDFLIPSSCIKDNKVEIAVRVYGTAGRINDLNFNLDNKDAAYYQNNIKNIFNQRIFLVLSILCAFIMVYAFASYMSDKKQKSLLYFAFCLFFIVFYFYDLGSENLLISYNIHRGLTRSFLPISMSFLALFMNAFFKRKGQKGLLIGMGAFDILTLIVFIVNCGSDAALGNLFTVMLAFVFAVIIYGFVCCAKALKEKNKTAVPIVIGFILGSVIALHDILYMVMDKTPFMWLQGFSFFIIDMAIFVTLSIKSGKTQTEVMKLADESSRQRDRLESMFESAKKMANDSADIANSLDESVSYVSSAAKASKRQAQEIGYAMDTQRRIQYETQDAMEHLTGFLKKLIVEFEEEANMIANTAEGTQRVIDGISTIGDGVSTAAEFTSSLSSITQTGSNDMKLLMDVMSKVQSSSKEILGVVTTLDDFAQQTDLLAMNASIEAAHAGESGKGFAVIAHEIKDLAQKSSQWSARIGEIITSIIDQIEEIVDLSTKVNSSLKKIEKGAAESASKVGAAADGMRMQQESGLAVSRESALLSESASKMKSEVLSQSGYTDKVIEDMQKLLAAFEEVDRASATIKKESMSLADEVDTLKNLSGRTSDAAHALQQLMKQ